MCYTRHLIVCSFIFSVALSALACGGDVDSPGASDTEADAGTASSNDEAVKVACAKFASCDEPTGFPASESSCRAFYGQVSAELIERCNDPLPAVAAYADVLRCLAAKTCDELLTVGPENCPDERAAYESAKSQQGSTCQPDDD